MPEDINEIRAQNAYGALLSYIDKMYPAEIPDESGVKLDESVVVDFLTDLMHYCSKAGLDFDDLEYRAQRHFDHEVIEEK